MDTSAAVAAGAPGATARVETVETRTEDADVDLSAGAPSASISAEREEIGSMETAATVTPGAADVVVTAEKRAAQLLHVRNVEAMGAVNELLTPIRHAGKMVGDSGVLVTLGYNCTLRVYRGSDLDVHPCDVVAEHVRVNLGLSQREVKVGSFLTSGEKEVGILAVTLSPGGQVQYVGLGRVPDEWHRLRIEMRLPNRFGQAANYREAMARLRRTQRLLASARLVSGPCRSAGGRRHRDQEDSTGMALQSSSVEHPSCGSSIFVSGTADGE